MGARTCPDAAEQVEWRLPGRPKPFARVHFREANRIAFAAEPGLTWARVADTLARHPQAANVAGRYVADGYGDHVAREMLAW